tara:strand:+ start:979 stop:1719 length:741 start_codon:yes stop_codon:yes gene_type:complete
MEITKKFKVYLKKYKFIYYMIHKSYMFFIDIKLKIKYFFGTNKDIFTDIYLDNKWGDKNSFSGTGSNLDQTKIIIRDLPNIIKQYKIKNILDIPCGDFYWMKEIDLRELNYIGADIVSKLINKNIKEFKRTNINFQIIDLLEDKIPDSDLIFCRDCLVHFSFRDIFKALKNIKKSNSKYLMTTNFFERSTNQDISTGSWRTINLCKPPFNFPEPLLTILENCTEGDNQFSDKSLSLWELSKIPNYK